MNKSDDFFTLWPGALLDLWKQSLGAGFLKGDGMTFEQAVVLGFLYFFGFVAAIPFSNQRKAGQALAFMVFWPVWFVRTMYTGFVQEWRN
jgi:hypothetical protein